MTAKIPSGGLIWLFGLIYILGYSCQLCQADLITAPMSHFESGFRYGKRSLNKPLGLWASLGLRRPEQQQNLLSWWYAHKRAPGSEFLGKRSSGPTGHELQELDKRVPGSEFLGKRVPGSEFLGKRVPGSEFLGKRAPGSVPGKTSARLRIFGQAGAWFRVPRQTCAWLRISG